RRACDQAAAPAWEAAPVGAPAALDEPVRPAAGGGVPAGARVLAVAGAAHAAPRPSLAAAAAVRLPWAAYVRVDGEASFLVAGLPSVSAQEWGRLCLYPGRALARGRLPASPAWLCFEPAMAAA